ncbi:MAG: hypothetical protein WB795_23250, partial [Candidatus Acidiferrales bacterium]
WSAAPIDEVPASQGILFIATPEREYKGVLTKTRMNASLSRRDRVIQPLKETYPSVLRLEKNVSTFIRS